MKTHSRRPPIRRGRVRPNGAALSVQERTAVHDGRDGTSAVTMKKYGGRQWYGLYEWIPVRGRGFECAFSWHEEERAARVERDDLGMVNGKHADRLDRLALEATGSRR